MDLRVPPPPAAASGNCPSPPPGTPAPGPAPVPPGPRRDFAGLRFGSTTGVWSRPGDEFELRLGRPVGSADGYGTWGEAVQAAGSASAGRAGAVAVCDDRGRLYLHEVFDALPLPTPRPLRLGERGETGYAFVGPEVRGLVDDALIAARGDCLVPWVPRPVESRVLALSLP